MNRASLGSDEPLISASALPALLSTATGAPGRLSAFQCEQRAGSGAIRPVDSNRSRLKSWSRPAKEINRRPKTIMMLHRDAQRLLGWSWKYSSARRQNTCGRQFIGAALCRQIGWTSGMSTTRTLARARFRRLRPTRQAARLARRPKLVCPIRTVRLRRAYRPGDTTRFTAVTRSGEAHRRPRSRLLRQNREKGRKTRRRRAESAARKVHVSV